MKNVIKSLKDPYIQKLIIAMGVQTIGTLMLSRVCTQKGLDVGAETVMNAAERMTPGFTEQLQKFLSAEHYGWKN